MQAVRPCSCGSERVAVNQMAPKSWEVRCTSCTAHVVGVDAAVASQRWNETQLKLYDRQQLKFQNGTIKDCCMDPRNLSLRQRQHDIVTYVCRVCGCRHRKMWAEPGVIFGKAEIIR